jgi:hypothetical protein
MNVGCLPDEGRVSVAIGPTLRMKFATKLSVFFLVTTAVLLVGCGLVSRNEVARVASPDRHVEAVMIETNGGTTTSFGYEIYVVESGRPPREPIAWLYGAARNSQAYGANLKWTNGNDLVIEYREAREETLKRTAVSVGGRTIKVSLRSGVNDPTAPPGGMLYNLQLTHGNPK